MCQKLFHGVMYYAGKARRNEEYLRLHGTKCEATRGGAPSSTARPTCPIHKMGQEPRGARSVGPGPSEARLPTPTNEHVNLEPYPCSQ